MKCVCVCECIRGTILIGFKSHHWHEYSLVKNKVRLKIERGLTFEIFVELSFISMAECE